MKKFSKFEVATIKRTAQNVNPMVSKKNKLKAEINSLMNEWNTLDLMQQQYEASIKTMTGGYGTEDLVTKIVETLNSVDKNGKPIKTTKFVLKYPETIIPTEVENIEESQVNAEEVNDSEAIPEVEDNTYNPLNNTDVNNE